MIVSICRPWEWIFLIFLLMPISSQAQDNTNPDYDSPIAPNSTSTAYAGAGNNSFIGNKTKDLIIILSVVVGVVVIISVVSSTLYIIAKRRQWAVREAVRRSARRVTDVIKTPLTPRFPRPTRDIAPRRNRSSRGMTKLETPPRVAKMNPESHRFEGVHDMRWGQSTRGLKRNKDFDLERGIELASTDNMKITVSTMDNSSRSGSSSNKAGGWGRVFAFGRG